ncbi:MAG: S8 family serine peptidase [Rhodospirillales bacterium]|nr:S8 family serine peptidase [Rhodospirillales bacterium]
MAVVAVTEDGGIAEYSNRCGLAAEWYIAAPGDNVNLAYFGPDEETGEPGTRGTWTGGGTSFAAPMVAGGLAVMKHRFRGQLSSEDLLARLLETADRTGRYSDEKVYGRGLMDLAAATSPVGGERVATGTRVRGLGRTLWSTRLGLGRAIGDSLERSLAGREIVAFDSLGAPFWHRLGDLMIEPAPSTGHARLCELLSEEPIGAQFGRGAPGRLEVDHQADWRDARIED